jgi:hypothetical protein
MTSLACFWTGRIRREGGTRRKAVMEEGGRRRKEE